MNIKITQILEGGIDLETMQELPRSMLLAFGDRRATMPVSEEQLGILMRLISADGPSPKLPAPSRQQHVNGSNGTLVDSPVDDEYADAETGVAAF